MEHSSILKFRIADQPASIDPSGKGALAPLRKDEEFVLYRAHDPNHRDARSFLVLAPVTAHPTVQTLSKIEHEYSLRGEIDSAGAVRPVALSEYLCQPALVLEDPGGEILSGLLTEPMAIAPFLRVAAALATAVGKVHERGLIHKDLKPANVLVNPATGEVWLLGFGIASRVPRERQPPEPPGIIAGTLPYMAPEQTGRMNRSIDSRSDLYSLGVTLYEMLTGNLPFMASDPMEWVHCHIARQPVPPRDRLPGVPGSVSAIIMKLLAKTAETRYQTAAGVEGDLRRCLVEWETQGRIDDFEPGQLDASDRLLIPEKLYGRELEVETLLAAFNRVVAGGPPELVLVSGYSGIGKSAVVNELHKVLVPPRGLFASGKFDQHKRDIPYSTLAQAFRSLTRRLLAKSDDELVVWRDALREALGPNAMLMVDLVPELALILDEQPPIPELPPQDAQRRFQLVLRRFISVFARPEHPLALFLDDLQWLDAATLDLVGDLLTQADVRHLLLIGAYRDNEVSAAHPLRRTLMEIGRAGDVVHEIVLKPISREDLGQLLADALHCEPERAIPLAELVHDKTGGNPFFSIEFLTALHQDRLVIFDYRNRRWSWDLNGIPARGYTDNVVDLVVGRLSHLSGDTQNALQRLACLGHSAPIALLNVIGSGSRDVHADLREAVRDGLVFRFEDSYRFLHDRVQEAAYSLIPEDSRANAHLRIGRLLVAHTPPEEREESIFDVVNQLNRGAALIHSRDERDHLAELNLLAGKRAKASTAYASALNYLVAGSATLGEDSWERQHELAFALEWQRADCEFLSGQLSAAAARLAALVPRASGTSERATVACLQMNVYTTLDQHDRAVAICLDYLRPLGIEWSAQPTEEVVRREYERIWSHIGGRRIEDLIDLPLMSSPDALDVVGVLTEVLVPALFYGEAVSSLVICRIVNLSLEYGNSDGSCFAYVWFGIIAGPRFGNYEAGYRFGQLGYDLVEKRGLKQFQARTYYCFGDIVLPWTKHVRAGTELVRRAFAVANEIGDATSAGICCDHLMKNMFVAGNHLVEMQREAERGLEFAQQARFGRIVDHLKPQLGLIRTLRGLTPTFGSLNDEQFDEWRFERYLTGNPSLAEPECWYWIRKLQARLFADDYASAVEASLSAQRRIATSPSKFMMLDPLETAEYHLFGALAHAASWDAAVPEQTQLHFEALVAHHRQLDAYAEHGPENFESRAALAAAEIARIEGRVLDAEHRYEQAIRLAHANGFLHIEALGNELAARFYAARAFEKIARAYLRDARYGYLRWGASGKVRQLERLYPELVEDEPLVGPARSIGTRVEHLDVATVIQISQAVSGEMEQQKLIDTLMRTAIEHAGAERGLLIRPRGDALQTEAEVTTSGNDVIVQMRNANAAPAVLPESLVRSVIRTREHAILDDASRPNPFSTDPYLVQSRARSILCLPLLHQAQLTGVLYLENTLAPHVFTPERITVLKVLATQAAISFENTRLYHDLAHREARIRRLVDANIVGICIWNMDGTIVGANDAFLRIVQCSRDDLVSGQVRWPDLVPPEWHELRDRALSELKTTGTAQPAESEIVRRDGSRVPILWGAALFEAGGSEGVAFVLDASEQKRAEAEIRALKDQLYRENLALREEVDRASMFEEIVGTSPALQTVLSRIAKVAPTDSTVLITGETGTGKELIARAVHKRSRRSGRPFVSVNCAALPPALITSELFGHEKGAFTGALQRRLGRFELADGGTIFLDEVGELLPDTQVALLRVLQEREFERVGGTSVVHVDVRVIAATNRDLEAAVANGTFRQDLFYRLNVFPIEVPPLRTRTGDILMLVEYFVERYATRAGKKFRSIDKKTLDLLQSYDWPGNIRELQNVVERSVILSPRDIFSVDAQWISKGAPSPISDTVSAAPARHRSRTEREMIEEALAESRGRVSGPSGAAARLRIPPSTLDHRIRVLKIDKSRFKFG